MRLSRGYFALATLGVLAFSNYSCSDDKSSGTSATGSGTAASTTSTTGVGGAAITSAGGSSTVGSGVTTVSGITGSITSAGGASTSMGGSTTGAGAPGTTDGGAGEGGAGSGCEDPEGEVVLTFDEPGLSGWSILATDDNEAGLADSFLMRSATEGVSCPGSLVLTVPFSVYGPNESAEAQYNFTADWSGYTTLYAMVKVAEPEGGSLGYLDVVQLFTNSAAYSMYHGEPFSGRTFEDFEWHEISIDLTEMTDLTDVNQLGVQLVVWDNTEDAVSGGVEDPPDAPETTMVYIDDIRLE